MKNRPYKTYLLVVALLLLTTKLFSYPLPLGEDRVGSNLLPLRGRPGEGQTSSLEGRSGGVFAFKGGEVLQYNTYFNWKFVWVKVGSATMTTTNSTFKGRKAYRCSLTTRGNGRADKLFVLRDTILCYTTEGLLPLYYRKGAREGHRYYVDELTYEYANNNCYVTMEALHNDGSRTKMVKGLKENVYDMLSIFLRARNFSSAGWKKGHVVKFPIADGSGMKYSNLVYRGVTTIKADDDHRYRCLELSYVEPDGKKMKEIVRFYVTDDDNHVPIRLDMFLRFGSAKAYMTSMKGLRNPVSARI